MLPRPAFDDFCQRQQVQLLNDEVPAQPLFHKG
jgi:hypothetical protein